VKRTDSEIVRFFIFSLSCFFFALSGAKKKNSKNEEAAAAREACRRRLRRGRRPNVALAAADGAFVPGVPLRCWEV
jgi:hypothetical protein